MVAYDVPWPLNDLALPVLLKYKEPLFVKKTIEQVLFKGWKVPLLEKIKNDVGIELPYLANNTFRLMLDVSEQVT